MAKNDFIDDLTTNEKVMIWMYRASEYFKKESTAVLADYGLTFSQYNILRAVNQSKNGENNLTNIRKIMLVSGANITMISKRLEKKGFLKRETDPNDERVKILKITTKGKRILNEIVKVKTRYFDDVLDNFPEELKLEMIITIKAFLKKAQFN